MDGTAGMRSAGTTYAFTHIAAGWLEDSWGGTMGLRLFVQILYWVFYRFVRSKTLGF